MSGTLFNNVAVIGVGLLGGSLALALKEKKLCGRVTGIGRSQTRLDEAKRMGAIDKATTRLSSGIADADLIVICTPVQHIISVLPDVIRHARAGALITEVGSTKTGIVRTGEAVAARSRAFFVGSHPMAGTEKIGVQYAQPDLFKGANCFVTKTPATNMSAFVRVCDLWRALDMRIVISRPERHDRLVALVSHLPHLVSVALVNAIDGFQEDKNLIKGIIGNGFRDTTRIAHGNAAMWEEISAENTDEIGATHAAFNKALEEIMTAASSDKRKLKTLFEAASNYREFFDE
ncbi:MAG: prephenate dehydrogenase [bacterium]